MEYGKLERILNGLKDISIAVLGDYCLDKYLITEPSLDEPSVETGLTAYQVVSKLICPGAAGTVVNNLRALGVGRVVGIGVVGDDGEGYELLKGLKDIGADTGHMVVCDERATCTYIKPMRQKGADKTEMNRFDIRNHAPAPSGLEDAVINSLNEAAGGVQAVMVLDQFVERDFGTVTDRVREALSALARSSKDLIIFADSRGFIGEFRDMIVKSNNHEVVKAVKPDYTGEPSIATVTECGAALNKRNGKPVFVTMGADGMAVFDKNAEHIRGINVTGPIDICGAGDAASAGIVAALAMGASPAEAALTGNLAASITIQQLGVTGTASPGQILERFKENFKE
jgi:rfaE bifunctional protein kinase chain/domain